MSEIPLDKIKSSGLNPRLSFDPTAMKELTETVRTYGVIEPITVRPSDGEFEVVVGERRLRAAKKAGLKKIPAVVKKLNDQQVIELMLIENLQREDLTPVEEAKIYKKLIDEFGYTYESLGKRIARTHAYISERISLLKLPETIVTRVTKAPPEEKITKKITFAKARDLLRLDKEKQVILAKKIEEEGLTTRETTTLVSKALEVEKLIEEVKRPSLKEKLKREVLPKVFEPEVTVGKLKEEIQLAKGLRRGPPPEKLWSQKTAQIRGIYEANRDTSFIREWQVGDRRYITLVLWMDIGEKFIPLVREDFKRSKFASVEEADKYAEERGGYCTGLVTIMGEEYWCIYVKPEKAAK